MCFWASPITKREQRLETHLWLCLLDQGPLTGTFFKCRHLLGILELLKSTEDKSWVMDELTLWVDGQIVNTLAKQQQDEGCS